jgi:pseudouridine-5'-phosphate glycosidase
METLPKALTFTQPVADALRKGLPVLAFESAVITHGLPSPQNLELARSVEAEALSYGVVPATIALLNQRVHIGLTETELLQLAAAVESGQPATRKVSRRDFGITLASGVAGGTTVAGTLIAARAAGIRVFATGGIGGVHRSAPFDVSADLPELARSPLVVVCAGAKAILDLPATFEVLESLGVPVAAYQADRLPAFYSRESGIPAPLRCDSPGEIARLARAQWQLGLENAVLVANPPPAEAALPFAQVERAIQQAVAAAEAAGVHGAALTPYLLERMKELTSGESLRANLALLVNNARLAAQIARELAAPGLHGKVI